jgi:hypothetical protein
MFGSDSPRIDFHPGLDVAGKRELLAGGGAEGANFIRGHKRGRAAAPVQLDELASWIDHGSQLPQLLLQVAEIIGALLLLRRDDRRAAAVPAEAVAERNMKVEREVTLRLVVRENLVHERRPLDLVGELRRGRIGRVARPGHVVFPDEVEVKIGC